MLVQPRQAAARKRETLLIGPAAIEQPIRNTAQGDRGDRAALRRQAGIAGGHGIGQQRRIVGDPAAAEGGPRLVVAGQIAAASSGDRRLQRQQQPRPRCRSSGSARRRCHQRRQAPRSRETAEQEGALEIQGGDHRPGLDAAAVGQHHARGPATPKRPASVTSLASRPRRSSAPAACAAAAKAAPSTPRPPCSTSTRGKVRSARALPARSGSSARPVIAAGTSSGQSASRAVGPDRCPAKARPAAALRRSSFASRRS